MALYVLPKYAVQSALLKNGKIVRALILSEEEAINEFISCCIFLLLDYLILWHDDINSRLDHFTLLSVLSKNSFKLLKGSVLTGKEK